MNRATRQFAVDHFNRAHLNNAVAILIIKTCGFGIQNQLARALKI